MRVQSKRSCGSKTDRVNFHPLVCSVPKKRTAFVVCMVSGDILEFCLSAGPAIGALDSIGRFGASIFDDIAVPKWTILWFQNGLFRGCLTLFSLTKSDINAVPKRNIFGSVAARCAQVCQVCDINAIPKRTILWFQNGRIYENHSYYTCAKRTILYLGLMVYPPQNGSTRRVAPCHGASASLPRE